MNKIYILLLFGLFISCNPKIIETTKPVEEDLGSSIEVDVLGNQYIYTTYELIKVNTNGDTMRGFNTRFASSIDHVSINNPNKITVFSKDNQKLWILDNSLGILDEFQIQDLELGDVTFATRLRDNNMLYYSRSEKKFFKIDVNGKIQFKTDVLWDLESSVVDVFQSGNQMLARMDNNELYLFDDFGNLIKKLPRQFNDGPLQFEENIIFQTDGENLLYTDIRDPLMATNSYKLANNIDALQDFKINRDKIYLLKNGKVLEEKLLIVQYK